MKIKCFAPAKLNLSLDVIGKRPDNYHEMLMVMQSVSLYDVLTVETNSEKTVLACDDVNVPTDERNTVLKCLRAFESYTKTKASVSIHLEKHIPYGAGMAGDSSDGAATLIALNKIYDTGLSVKELISIGKTVGADIPFCLIGGTAKVEGIGEIVTPVKPVEKCFFVIVKPEASVSTKEAFHKIDNEEITFRPNTEKILSLLEAGEVKSASALFMNVFEEATDCEEVKNAKNLLLENKADSSLMTGSGSAVFGVFFDKQKAEDCLKALKSRGLNAFFAEPCGGVTITE